MGRPKNPPKKKYKHGEVQDIVAAYLMTAGRIRIVCKEAKSKHREVPDIYAVDRRGTYMVEVKVSHKDFLADARKPFRKRPKEGVGKWRYYALSWKESLCLKRFPLSGGSSMCTRMAG